MHQSKANILLVDDRADGLLALEVVLRSPHYNLITASSGEEALRWLMGNTDDLAVILLDVQMPRMDGFETANLIKCQERYRHVPIIFVTGINGDPRLVSQGYEAGAIDYVTKPFQPSILRSKVAVLVELHQTTKLLDEMQEKEHQRELEETRRKLESEFQARERKLIALVENSSDFISIADNQQRVIYLNKAGRELVGISDESEVYTKSLGDFLSPQEQARFVKDVLPKGFEQGWEDELCFISFATEREFPVWSRGFPLRDPKTGAVDGIATINRDITRQKAYERAVQESEQRFRILTSCAPVGIFFTDAQGRFLFVNQVWLESAGLTEAEVQDEAAGGWLRAIHPEDRERISRAWQKSIEGELEFCDQFRFHRANGQVTWIQSKSIPLRDDLKNVIGYIGSCVDVTDRVRSEEVLRNAAEALTRTNGELQRFAWVASHDLKEPLRMVASYVQLLRHKYAGKIDRDADLYIHYAVQGASRMYSIVDGIMTLSGLDRCVKQARIIDCNRVFDSALDSLQVAIAETGAVITRGDLPPVNGDSTQMGQLFQNLISNAIKFCGTQTPIVDVRGNVRGSEVVFAVRDNGIGIERDYCEKIFGVFQRLHPGDRYPGTGVGLAICKKIVERHGGKIWVESQPGQGSTFYFFFPVPRASN